MRSKQIKLISRLLLISIGCILAGYLIMLLQPPISELIAEYDAKRVYKIASWGYKYSNGLNLAQNKELMEFFQMDCDKDLDNLENSEDFTLTVTEETERILLLWDYVTIDMYDELLYWTVPILSQEEHGETDNYDNTYVKYLRGVPNARIDKEFIQNYQKEAYAIIHLLPKGLKEKMLWRNEYGMNLKEHMEYKVFFRIGIDQVLNSSWTREASIPSLDVISDLSCDENTVECINILNQILWEHNNKDIEKLYFRYNEEDGDFFHAIDTAVKVSTGYAFNIDNPITVEWVEKNPMEAYNMIREFPTSFFVIVIKKSSESEKELNVRCGRFLYAYQKDYVRKIYERIYRLGS